MNNSRKQHYAVVMAVFIINDILENPDNSELKKKIIEKIRENKSLRIKDFITNDLKLFYKITGEDTEDAKLLNPGYLSQIIGLQDSKNYWYLTSMKVLSSKPEAIETIIRTLKENNYARLKPLNQKAIEDYFKQKSDDNNFAAAFNSASLSKLITSINHYVKNIISRVEKIK